MKSPAHSPAEQPLSAWLRLLNEEISSVVSQLKVEKEMDRTLFLYERLYDLVDVSRRSIRVFHEVERVPLKRTPYELLSLIEKAVAQAEKSEDNTKFSTIQRVLKQLLPEFDIKDYFRVNKFSDLLKLAEKEGLVKLQPQVAPEEVYLAPTPAQDQLLDVLSRRISQEKKKGNIVLKVSELQRQCNRFFQGKLAEHLKKSGFSSFEELLQRARKLGRITLFSLGDELMVYGRD